jgi:hypothetical protein
MVIFPYEASFMVEIISLVTLGLLIFVAILQVFTYFKGKEKITHESAKSIQRSRIVEKDDFRGDDGMDEDNEKIVAVISAALMAYSTGKIVSVKGVNRIDESCHHVGGWLMHSPQKFWKVRKG